MMKRTMNKRIQKAVVAPTSRTKEVELQGKIVKFDRQLAKSVSCPSFKLSKKIGQNLRLRHTTSQFHITEHNFQKCKLLPNCMEINFLQVRAASTSAPEKSVNAAKNLASTCACPVPSSCLPPPCNTPAKCLQYMTGYYYYPYGTWFCGPYHVSTGSCPCAGPVKPGGACGPILPCPGDPCGPICCKPLSCCGVCGIGGPFQSNNNNNAYNPWHFGSANMYSSYNPYPQNSYEYNAYNSYNSYPPYGHYSGFNGMPPNFGQCYNVPITPVPVTIPMTPEATQANTESSAPKSAISWHLSKSNINQDSKASPSKSAINNPSAKTVTPKPYPYPPSSYQSKSNLSKANPYTKPRINARTLQQSNSIGICYFSTKCIRKYAKKSRKLSTNSLKASFEPKKLSGVTENAREDLNGVKDNTFNYWPLLSDGNKKVKCELGFSENKLQ